MSAPDLRTAAQAVTAADERLEGVLFGVDPPGGYHDRVTELHAAIDVLRAALAAEQHPTCTDGRSCAYERNGLDACDRACALQASDPDDVAAFMAEDAAPGGAA